MNHALIRFCKYSLVGGSTLLVDLALLYVLKEYFGVNYLVATGVGFLVGVSINYVLSRRFVFSTTTRGHGTAYMAFLSIAGVGLGTLELLMWVAVSVLGNNYLLSRVVIAGIVGMWNYLMNLYINFNVAGE